MTRRILSRRPATRRASTKQVHNDERQHQLELQDRAQIHHHRVAATIGAKARQPVTADIERQRSRNRCSGYHDKGDEHRAGNDSP